MQAIEGEGEREKGERRKGERRKEKGRREKEEREKGSWRKEYPSIHHPACSCVLWTKTRREARKWAKDELGKYASSLWGFVHHDTNHDSAKPKERTSREERAARARGTQARRRPVRRSRKSRGRPQGAWEQVFAASRGPRWSLASSSCSYVRTASSSVTCTVVFAAIGDRMGSNRPAIRVFFGTHSLGCGGRVYSSVSWRAVSSDST